MLDYNYNTISLSFNEKKRSQIVQQCTVVPRSITNVRVEPRANEVSIVYSTYKAGYSQALKNAGDKDDDEDEEEEDDDDTKWKEESSCPKTQVETGFRLAQKRLEAGAKCVVKIFIE